MPQFLQQHGDWTSGEKFSGSSDRNGEPSASMLQGSCDNSSITELLRDNESVKNVLKDFEKQKLFGDFKFSFLQGDVDKQSVANENKAKECMQIAQKHLARVYGLKKVSLSDGTYYYKYSGSDPK